MLKLDFKRDFKQLYSPSAKDAGLVEVPKLNFLMIDGTGDPNTATEYKAAVEALYSLAYTLKFMLKKAEVLDYGVPSLEGLWWTEKIEEFSLDDKSNWLWTMMIMQPEQITLDLVEQARNQAEKKKNLTELTQIRFETFDEGLAAQIMHLGPYANEAPTVEKLHKFITENGYSFRGKHHEIYLSDPNRSAPENMKTIIRQPITR